MNRHSSNRFDIVVRDPSVDGFVSIVELIKLSLVVNRFVESVDGETVV